MQLPSWLANLTGATQFANNPANNFAPTFGDALQGIGHSMAEHYRRGQADGASNGGLDGALKGLPPIEKVALHFAPQGDVGQMPQVSGQVMAPPPVVQPAPTQVPTFNDPSAIMKILQGSAPATSTAGGLAGLFR
jgi:hypothetical protein